MCIRIKENVIPCKIFAREKVMKSPPTAIQNLLTVAGFLVGGEP